MAAIKIETFIRALEQSNLLPGEVVQRVKRRVTEGSTAVDPRSIAKWLIDKQYLTLWQANKLLAGRTAFYLGRYMLLDRIGQGGMGVVFKARHAVMDRVVALKVMSQALLDKPHAVARFNREVKTAAALIHPNIITAFDADCVGNTHFLVMEFADGYDLNQWLLARGPLPISAACEFAMQAAEGLGHAFRQGMVHRDIKPVNLLLIWNPVTNRPVVKILDLGLARFVSETQEDGGLTRIGQTIGTPDYIAPEAAENFKQADIRADIFSLGCALFKLLTGRLPYGGTNTMEKLLARATKPAPLVRTLCPEVPVELEAVLAKMLATNPADRYQSPAEVAAALAPFAASTLGDQAVLDIYRESPAPALGTVESIEADGDTSLDEFFRDFAVQPLREEGAPPAPPPSRLSDDEDLQLVPLDDDPPAGKGIAPVPPQPGGIDAPRPKEKPPSPAKPAGKESDRATAAAVAARRSIEEAQATDHAGSAGAKKSKSSSSPRSSPGGRGEKRPARGVGSLADALNVPGAASPGANLRERRGAGKERRNLWDSSLLLWSGGGLLVLIIAGAALLWATYRQGSDAMLALANESYKGGAYAQAERQYATFLTDFPRDDQASFARVRHGLARVRVAAESKSDWSGAYQTAQRVLAEISDEEKFREGQEELASLLPTIAEGLAEQANKKQQQESVDQAQLTLELVNRYVPKSLRAGQRLQAIVASLEVTTRQMARQQSLAKTVALMEQSAKSGSTGEAYQARQSLLKAYPDLARDEKLQAAVLDVSRAEQARVSPIEKHPAPQQGEPSTPVAAAVSFAAPRLTKPVAAEVPVVFCLAEGSTFAVESATGKLLWRRHLGYAIHWLPTNVSASADSDVLLTDDHRREVIRVNRRTGAVAWRCSLEDQPIAPPYALESQAVAAGATGKLCWFDSQTGAATHALQLPQSLRVAPVADRRQQHVYQVADHSNLYVLSASGDNCEEVFYLGHESGTVAVPPVVTGRYLMVVENDRMDDATLRILLTDEQGLAIKLIQELPLEGHVHATPVVEERSLFVVTDQGGLYLFEIGTPDKEKPIEPLIVVPPPSEAHVPHQFAVRGDKLWVGAEQLTSYTIQMARGKFVPDWVKQQREICSAPLQLSGNFLFYCRSRPGFDGAMISAIERKGGTRSWDAALASPLAGGPQIRNDLVWAVTSDGSLFRGDAIRLDGATSVNEVLSSEPPKQALDSEVVPAPLGRARLVFAPVDDPLRLLVVALSKDQPGLSWLKLTEPAGGGVAALAGNLIVPGRNGRVEALDAATGQPRLGPFHPPLRGGEIFNWSAPCELNEESFLISDLRARLYRVEIQKEPQPHLAVGAQADLPVPIVSELAVLAERVYAVAQESRLLAYGLPGLEPLEPVALEGNVTWGPARIGEQLLLTTDREQMMAIGADGKPRWTAPLEHGPLAGPPLEVEGALYCATAQGIVCRLDPNTGKEQAKIDLQQALASGPVHDGKRLLIGGRDGTLLAILPP